MMSQLPALSRKSILVVGELVLDKYSWGTVDRISPEAPIPVVRIQRREARPGNAAFVCATLRSLGASVSLVSVAGADGPGRMLRRMLNDLPVSDEGVVEDPSRPTIVKERLFGSVQSAMRGTQQLLRLDEEDARPLDTHVEESVIRSIVRLLPCADGVLVSDINKGLLTPRVLEELISGAARRGVPIVVDPRLDDDFSIYRGATVLTPNRYEAERASRLSLTGPGSWEAAGQKLMRSLNLECCLVTLDRDGMFLTERNGRSTRLPTTPLDVYDVTGAGDVALSVFGLCLIAGVSAVDAGQIANVAAGLEVGKQGASVISAEELNSALMGERDEIKKKIVPLKDLDGTLARHREAGHRVCFTHGAFESLYAADVRTLEYARSQADVLVVGISGDRAPWDIHEPGGARCCAVDRARLVAAVEAVDYVTVFDRSAAEIVRTVKPQVVVKRTVRPNEVSLNGMSVDPYGLRALTLQWRDRRAAQCNLQHQVQNFLPGSRGARSL